MRPRSLYKNSIQLVGIVFAMLLGANTAFAQTSSFTYQGRLTDGGTAANGNYDLQFALFDSASGGTQIGATQTVPNILVSAGIFTVPLDFGANAFPGANRWLEISARLTGTPSFTTLSPRQPITSTPYAIRSLNASSADTVTVSGVPGGSGNYIQNNPPSQQAGNFNISGNGTAGGTLSAETVNAATQYNIGSNRVLSVMPGGSNIFVGINAGIATTNFRTNNAFFGSNAGRFNDGNANAFFGNIAGFNNVIGGGNAFFGRRAGFSNTEGNENTVIGYLADVGSNNLTNATALGAQAQVDQSNSLVLGSVNGVNGATSSVNVGIGTTAPLAALDTRGTMLVSGNVGIGTTTPLATLHVNGVGAALVTIPGGPREISIGTPNGETGIGIKGINNRADVRFDGSTLRLVAGIGTLPPSSTNGLAIDASSGTVAIGQVSSSATSIHVCLDFLNRLAFCSSSLRYKERVAPFSRGLDLIRRLRPISFTWKNNGTPDLGLGAEDVAKVEPLLVTHNDKGEIQGVKYDQLNVVLINAIKEQQAQIEHLRTSNAALQSRLRAVEKRLRKRAGPSRRRH